MRKHPTLKVIRSGALHSHEGKRIYFSKVTDAHHIIPWKIKVASEKPLPIGEWITAEYSEDVPNGRYKIPFLKNIAPSSPEAVQYIREHHWLAGLQSPLYKIAHSKFAKNFSPLKAIGTLAALALAAAVPSFTKNANPLNLPPTRPLPSSGNPLSDSVRNIFQDIGRAMIALSPAQYNPVFRFNTVSAAEALKQGLPADKVDQKIVDNAMMEADPAHKLDKSQTEEQEQKLSIASQPYLRFLQQNVDKFANGNPSKWDLNDAYVAAWQLRTAEDNLKGSLLPKYSVIKVHHRHHFNRHP